MKLLSALILLGSFLIVSCGFNEGTVYYPKYHYTALSKTIGGEVVYLQWGSKLVDLKSPVTLTNSARKLLNYIKVQDKLTGALGYVDAESVVKNPVVKGVILRPSIAYNIPSFSTSLKQTVNPPVLLYVMEIKDGDWARIEPYNASAYYNISNTIDETTRIYQNKWLSLNDISTNQMSINVLTALQIAIKKYHDAKKLIENNMNDEKILKESETAIKTEVEALKKVIETYPEVEQFVLDLAQEFFNAAGPLNDSVEGTSEGSSSLAAENNGEL